MISFNQSEIFGAHVAISVNVSELLVSKLKDDSIVLYLLSMTDVAALYVQI